MKTTSSSFWTHATIVLGLSLGFGAQAQVNAGSNGSDGAFNPTVNTVLNMASHPNGIYQYTSINTPANVTVTFTPNVNNTPVIWLVQGNVAINGSVDVSGQTSAGGVAAGRGGPGGSLGGYGGATATSGQGPGGGGASRNGSYGTSGYGSSGPPGSIYGNNFLIPLLGGSGGGGRRHLG